MIYLVKVNYTSYMIRSRIQGMYWCAHKTATLTSYQHTVYGLWCSQTGDTKLERFLPSQHTQRQLLNFEFWINGECQNLTFKVNFLCQKSFESFSIFFLLKKTNFGAIFLLLIFFDKINF